jgi:membrane protease YdiL (CAAX protease family)
LKDIQKKPQVFFGYPLISLKKKAAYAYTIIFLLNFLSYLFHPALSYLLPFLLVSLPLVSVGEINIKFSIRQTILGLIVSLATLIPFSLVAISLGKVFVFPPLSVLFYQLLGISFPEETFFRGFLQNSLGNNRYGIIITSILFTATHLPRFLFFSDWTALLTFFPSLLMGWLYMRTSNILPSIVFHFMANIVFIGFSDR